MYNAKDIVFNKCEMHDNEGYGMIAASNTSAVFKKCSFYNNDCTYGFVSAYESGSTFEFKGCSFGDQETYSINNMESLNEMLFDSKCSFDDSFAGYADNEPNGAPVTEYPQEYYAIESILQCIEDDGNVSIPAGYYNLSDFLNYVNVSDWNSSHQHVLVEEVFDGYQITISDMDEVSISGDSNFRNEIEIVTDPRYADVFNFVNCTNISIANMTLGHTELGSCAGDVLEFSDCSKAYISNMDMYGCGVYGISAYSCGDFEVYDCFIHDCEYGFADITDTKGKFVFEQCALYNSDGSISLYEIEDEISFKDCAFGIKEIDIMDAGYSMITFENCFEYGEG